MVESELRPALRTMIVDDEPLAVERLQVICAGISGVEVVGTASDGDAALRLVPVLSPDLVLLDMTMPGMDGLTVARRLAQTDQPPAVVFVTAHDEFAVDAFDLDAVDYVLKPVHADRLARAASRALARRGTSAAGQAQGNWLREFWVPHHAELLRIEAAHVRRIDAERDYVRLHIEGDAGPRSYLLLQRIARLEERLDPQQFIRIHRSTIVRRDTIAGLRHEGLGVWSVDLTNAEGLRIGRTYLERVKALTRR